MGVTVPECLVNLLKHGAEVKFTINSDANGKRIQKVSDQGLYFRTFAVGQRCSDDEIGLSGVAGEPDMERGKHRCEESCGFAAG